MDRIERDWIVQLGSRPRFDENWVGSWPEKERRRSRKCRGAGAQLCAGRWIGWKGVESLGSRSKSWFQWQLPVVLQGFATGAAGGWSLEVPFFGSVCSLFALASILHTRCQVSECICSRVVGLLPALPSFPGSALNSGSPRDFGPCHQVPTSDDSSGRNGSLQLAPVVYLMYLPAPRMDRNCRVPCTSPHPDTPDSQEQFGH
ncbi:hypothetical protein B0T22DRAFT_124178 [Podospora appendiculata]|uniref:Uncharacterized protein n=1 Tax=Podospora appendiculata TaxID=314037 RepID=A0AAE1CBB6_9PEZI|nr:hypothetical protein B0T22DRAFT_124178 [Podospora appendiculata]